MKRLNIIIPCLNEERRLIPTLQSYVEFLKKEKEKASEYDIRLYIVNDGSVDNTFEVAREFIGKYNIEGDVLTYKRNRGKGFAVKYGLLTSRPADYYYMSDCDLSAPWETMFRLLDEIKDTDYGAAIGSRYLKSSETNNSFVRKLFGRVSWFMTFFILGLNYQDTQCGYKIFTAKTLPAFKFQKIERWGFDFEILHILKLLGIKVKEVGIKWKADTDSRVKPKDYVKTFTDLLKVKLTKYEDLDDKDLFSREFLWYFLIGLIGVGVDFGISALFKEILGASSLWANFAGMNAGIINNFIFNSSVNFKVKDNVFMRFVTFYSVGLLGIVVGSIIMQILNVYAGLNFYAVKIIATVIVSVLQFFLNKNVSFRKI